MKKILRYSLLLFILLLIPITTVNAKEKTLGQWKTELNKIQKQLEDTNNKKAQNQKDIDNTNSRINSIYSQMEKINSDIDKKTKESEQLEKDIDKKNNETKDLMRYYQVSSSGSSMLEYIMGAESLTDLIYRLSITEQISNYNKKVVEEMNSMIKENDKIAVGISGGKDSLTLLYALSHLRKFYPDKFDIVAVTVDLGFDNLNLEEIREFCKKLGVEYQIIKTQIAEVVFQVRKESNPCSLCAKMRKGALNDAIKELGCNKVAYAHHKDDLLESMMMSFLFEGRIHTFAPVTYLDRSGLTVIRPLLFLYEGDVKGFVKEYNLPVVKSPCPVDGSTKRENVKNLIGEINHQYPGAKARMIRAVIDDIVNPDCPPQN